MGYIRVWIGQELIRSILKFIERLERKIVWAEESDGFSIGFLSGSPLLRS
jgi:hypothetical protein